jgi:hypothetical protein
LKIIRKVKQRKKSKSDRLNAGRVSSSTPVVAKLSTCTTLIARGEHGT